MAPTPKNKKTKYTKAGVRSSRRQRGLDPITRCNTPGKRHMKKCPKCCGSGRVTKKKGCRISNNLWPQFFKYIICRAKSQCLKDCQQLLMKKAAKCWNRLTKEQREEFRRQVNAGEVSFCACGGSKGGSCGGGKGSGGGSGGKGGFSFSGLDSSDGQCGPSRTAGTFGNRPSLVGGGSGDMRPSSQGSTSGSNGRETPASSQGAGHDGNEGTGRNFPLFTFGVKSSKSTSSSSTPGSTLVAAVNDKQPRYISSGRGFP